MSIQEQIREDMKDALKNKEEIKLTVLRGVLSGFTNELVANKKTPQEPIDDDLAMKVLQRNAKQRKDSIEQFEKGGRTELVANEKQELEIIEAYLPEQMSKEDIKKVVQIKKQELNIENSSQIGMLMGAVMKELKGQADGNLVKEIIEKSLN